MNASRPTRYSGCICARLAALLAAFAAGLSNAAAEPGKSEAGSALRQFTIAKALQERKHFGPAAEKWAEFLKNHASDSRAADALCNLGICQFGDKKFTEAAAAFIQVITDYPKSDARETAWLHLGLAQYNLAADGQTEFYAKAADNLAKYLKLFPNREETPQATFFLAEALNASGKKAEAVEAYTHLIAKHPNNALVPDALYAVGVAHEELGQATAAGANYDTYLKRFPTGPQAAEVTLRRGETLFAQKDYEQAAKWFAAAAARPGFADADVALFRQATALYELKRYGEAADVYTSVGQKLPDSPLAPKALYGLAWVRITTSDFSGAVEALDTLLAKDAAGELAPRARFARALARVELKEFAPALDDVQVYLQSQPAGDDKHGAQYVLGVCQARLNQNEEAVRTFRSILDQSPAFTGGDKVLYELALALRLLGRGEEATDAFRRLAKEYADSPLAAEALFEVGETEYQAGNDLAAAAAFHKSMQSAGKNALGEKAAHKLGLAQFRQNAFDKARRTFAYQLATWPKGVLADDAAFMVAEALFKQGKYADALPYYQRVKSPTGKEMAELAALRAGQTQGRLKQWQASLATLAQATKEHSNSEHLPEMLCEEAWARQNLGQLDLALKRYEEVTIKSEAEAAARARFRIGEIYARNREHDKAIKNFIQAAYGYGYPRWQARAHYEAGRCYEALGKKEQAVKSYREVTGKFPHSDQAAPAKRRLAALAAAK